MSDCQVAEYTNRPLPSSMVLPLINQCQNTASSYFMVDSEMNPPSLSRFAWLSIAAAIATIGLKTAAYWLTGSVGLLSDAIESLVNLVGGAGAVARGPQK
jgi:hypothetical protein